MRIGLDARLTYYRTGGISTYIRRLVETFATMPLSEDQLTVFESRKQRQSIVPPNLRRAPLWTPSHHRLERLALSAELLPHRLNVLHSPDFIPPLRGARHRVITVHDLTFLHYPQYLTDEARRYYNGQINTAVQQADHILTDSEASKRDMITMLSVPAEKITVHRLGVDDNFAPQPPEVCERWRTNLELPASYFLFVGTFEPRKNIIGLLDAYRALRSTHPDAPPLVLAGTRGWLYEQTLAHINQLHLNEHVLLRENVPQAALPALYTMAIALLTPSFYEGFGLPALEAMACGTPPIVSNRSSLPEVVGDVGLQVNPNDVDAIEAALHRALTDVDWRAGERIKGIARAKQFRWEETAHITWNTYLYVAGMIA